MGRKLVASAVASGLVTIGALGFAPAAGAASRTALRLDQSAAFAILGASCGGIQEQSYSTGFAASGYPSGDVYLTTTCGGSGRGGGYKSKTYSAWAVATWDWFGETRSSARLTGSGEASGIEATDAHGDRIYNEGATAYLETTSPPLTPPAAPTGVSAVFSPIEVEPSEEVVLRFQVSWSAAPETAGLISSSTVTATPIGASGPVVTATVNGGASSVLLSPLQPHTSYAITVTSTDAEGTSAPSEAAEAAEAYSEGTKPPPPAVATCEHSQGTITLSPGLSETPHVQAITIKGQLSECDGARAEVSAGTYTARMQSTEEVTCSQLATIFAEPNTTPAPLTVKWSPAEAGKSTGTLIMPVTEEPGQALGGTIQGGPFAKPLGLVAASLAETFIGGHACGVPGKGGKAKPVKKGTFTTAQLEIGRGE